MENCACTLDSEKYYSLKNFDFSLSVEANVDAAPKKIALFSDFSLFWSSNRLSHLPLGGSLGSLRVQKCAFYLTKKIIACGFVFTKKNGRKTT